MNHPLSLISTIFIGIVGAAVFLVQPGYVQGLVEYYGFTDKEAGYLASADMLGMAITSITISFKITHMRWRPLITFSLIIMVLGNLMSASVTDFHTLMGLRFIIGLGEGGVVPLTFAAIAMTRHQDRNFGLYIAGCLIYGALGLITMPQAFSWWGMEGIFIFFAVFSASALMLVQFMPHVGREEQHNQKTTHISPLLVISALLAMFCYFIAQGIAWAYLFLMGTAGGLNEQAVANGLTICQFLGIAGALTATLLAGKFGRAIPLSIGILLGIFSLALLFNDMSFMLYAVAVSLFNYSWNMVHPYLLASMASFDDTGKVVIWAVALQTLGLGIGPFIGASVITSGVYDNVSWASIMFFALSLILILPPIIASGAHRFNLARA